MKNNKIWLLLIIVIIIIGSIGIGVLMKREATFNTRKIYGKIDIGGYGLFVNCYGKGQPTVLFESGLGGPGENSKQNWIFVQKDISKIARTFSYDRAGLGDSDSCKLERSSLNQVHELHTLLKNAKVKGPYIIVAHSIGGYNVRLFADLYPDEVAGIVFVDCAHEKQIDDRMKTLSIKEIQEWRKQYAITEQNLDQQIISARQVQKIRNNDAIRNIPIFVLTADHKGLDFYKNWKNYQKDITSLSNKSKHTIVENCGHYIQMEKPQVVIDAIKDIIKEVD